MLPRPGNPLIDFLSDFCSAHPLDEKIVVSPSHRIGHQIGAWLTKTGVSWVNLRFMTIPSLALDCAGEIPVERGMRLLGETGELLLLEEVFRGERESGRLEYFSDMPSSWGFIRALRLSMRELRLEGKSGRDIDPGDFRRGEKGKDLKRLMRAWEKALRERRGLDLPALLELGIEGAANRSREASFILIPSGSILTELESRLIRCAAANGPVLLPVPDIPGLELPRRMSKTGEEFRDTEKKAAVGRRPPSSSPPGSDLERIRWLFAPESAPSPAKDGTLSQFCGIGAVNECREALRRILKDRRRFDDVEILHPPGPDYPTALYMLAVALELPLTLAEGLPVGFTAPGRALRKLVDWIESGYPAAALAELVESGSLLPESDCAAGEGRPSPSAVYLRSAGIGWGRERYQPCLSGLIRECRERARRARLRGDAEEGIKLRETETEIRSLGGWANRLLGIMPETGADGRIEFRELSLRMIDVLTRHAGREGEADRAGMEAIHTRLLEAARFAHNRMTPGESLVWLRSLSEDLTCGSSGPLPGTLHAASLDKGGWSGRPLTYMLGLNQGVVPRKILQDPILLDEERERLDEFLPRSEDHIREDLYRFAVKAASLWGEAVLSFSAYDPRESRPAFPSSLILQAVRLERGDAGLDYSSLPPELTLDGAVGFVPGPENRPILGEREWWLGRLLSGGIPRDGREAVREAYPELGRGIAAAEIRRGEAPSEFEGIIRTDGSRFSPARNPALVFSASRLENLSKCPFGYFLRYILKVEEPEEIIYDPDRWLNPLDRGSLLHEVFERFMRELREKGEHPDVSRHGGRIESLGEEVILRYRELIPPPSESVFEKERNRFRRAFHIFLRVEAARDASLEPVFFEVRFGMKGSGEGTEKPALIRAAGGRSLRLRGRIDRVDRTGPHCYRVTDYKTGRAAAYDGFEYFDGGRKLQHALYREAARHILMATGRDSCPRIVESGYAFLSEKGDGRERMLGEIPEDSLEGLLGELMDLLERGWFPVFPDSPCGYCEYAPICGDDAVGRARRRRDRRPEYSVFRRLREYK